MMPGSGDRIEEEKRGAAHHAITHIEDNMVVGLGTGSTAKYAIDALGNEVSNGLDIEGVPTSYQSADSAREAGIRIVSLDDIDTIDVTIDGADQVSNGDAIKGGGAAHTREKVIANLASTFIVIVDSTKISDRLSAPIPVEILPDTRNQTRKAIAKIGGEAEVREANRKAGPLITDNGNFIMDCRFGEITDPKKLGNDLANIPGVIDHGLFVDMIDEMIIGKGTEVMVKSFRK